MSEALYPAGEAGYRGRLSVAACARGPSGSGGGPVCEGGACRHDPRTVPPECSGQCPWGDVPADAGGAHRCGRAPHWLAGAVHWRRSDRAPGPRRMARGPAQRRRNGFRATGGSVMTATDRPLKVSINALPTGVPGLDEVLGGGLPEYSFNLIAGAPGTGKTTLAHQILFSLASSERQALYFSVVGEPVLKMLRYQQQMAYFDPAKVGVSIDFINLSDAILTQGLDRVLADIVRQVEERGPGLVVLDSFHNIAHRAAGRRARGALDIQGFVQRLAMHLTTWQATTFLLGNYRDEDLRDNPVFTVADGILWLSQIADQNSVVRKLQVVKMRGQEPMPGLHTIRLDRSGLQVFPRISIGEGQAEQARPPGRAVTGVPGLDALVGGGLPAGDAVLVSGPSGTGKSVLTAQFIAAGVRQGEPGVIAVFEEHPQEYLRRAQHLGLDLEAMVREGSL